MNAPFAPNTPAVPLRGRLRRGALMFAGLTLAGLVGAFLIGKGGGTSVRLVDLQVGFLLLALASALADVVLGGLRFHIFIRRTHPRSPLWLPIRADLGGRFVGAVTPSQTGGGPAQVFILHRGGVPVPEALSLLLINLIASLLVLLLAGSLAVESFRDRLGGALLPMFRSGLILVLGLLGVAIGALVRPELVSRPLERLARRPEGGDGPRPKLVARVARLLLDSLEHYRVACRRFVRECPWLPVASFALTVLIYLNKFGLAWLVMRGLGIENDFVTTITLMALIHISLLLIPTPGGSGLSELAIGAFISTLLPGSLIGPFTLIYRLLLSYLPAAAGGCVLLAEFATRRAREPARAHPAIAAVLVLVLGAGATAVAEAGGPCPLCCDSAPATMPLPRWELEAAAERLAARNRREIRRIDSLFLAARLGPPESPEARARARLLARMTLANWYSFLTPYVEDPERVRTVTPQDIVPIAARYCEAIAVPMPRLRELRLGRGHVCARYDLGVDEDVGSTVLGGRNLRYRVGDRSVGSEVRRVVGLDWPSADMGKVEVLVEEHYGFRLARTRLDDQDGNRIELFLALDVSGGWVRRYGVHRPAGFAFWTTRPGDAEPYVPRNPRVGSAIYVPGLCFKLPLLPDLELDDVRTLGLPMPFVDARDLHGDRLPSWLPSAGEVSLSGWTSEGPLPPSLREHFPEYGRRPQKRAALEPGRMAGSQ